MAQEWLQIAPRKRQIGDAEFRRESYKLTVTFEPVLA
jgi:hypothetical protein